MKNTKEDILLREDTSVIDTKEFDELSSLFKKTYSIEREVYQFDQYQGLLQKAFKRKSLIKSVVDNTHSFNEYLSSLIDFHEVDSDNIYAIVDIDLETLEGLKQGTILPWHLQHTQVFSLLNVINGVFKDALEKIKETEIHVDEDLSKSMDLGLVARSQRKPNTNRREMFSSKNTKFLRLAEQRKKSELIQAIYSALI